MKRPFSHHPGAPRDSCLRSLVAQFEYLLAMRGRLSILGNAKEESRPSTRRKSKRGSHYRAFDWPICAEIIRLGREENAQRGRSDFRTFGRKQGRQGSGSNAVCGKTRGHRAQSRARTLGKTVTTIVSLAARDFIAVGCDSLATTSTDLLHPFEVTSVYFESNGDLKLDATGKPLLQHANQIWEKARKKSIDQLPSVTKLYDLGPLKACALFAGASRIGNTTIAHIVATFLACPEMGDGMSQWCDLDFAANVFKNHVLGIYEAEIPEKVARPLMEVLLSGYSANFREPELWRLVFAYNPKNGEFECDVANQIPRGEYNVIFGGQYDVIQ